MNVFTSVIGDDDRNPVAVANELPWSRICSLEFEARTGRFRGTGWLAGPTTVITAGHCLHSLERYGGMATAVSVFPGREQSRAPFGPYRATRFSCAPDWIANEDIDADIGAIHLDAPVDARLGAFDYSIVDPHTLAMEQVVVSGYPEAAGSFDNLWTASGRVRAVSPNRVFYEADTSDGQSGAPVWLASDDPRSPVVIAVHTREKEFTPRPLPEANSATLINARVAQQIHDWLAA